MPSEPVRPYLYSIDSRIIQYPGDFTAVFGCHASLVIDIHYLADLDAINSNGYRIITTDTFFHFLYYLYQETGPVFRASPVFIGSPVPVRREEVVEKVAAAGIYIDTVEPGFFGSDCSVGKLVYNFFYLSDG